MRSHDLGSDGEDIAAEYLEENGYEILDRRYKRRGGELDIVCCERDAGSISLLVFVEVKTRSPSAFGGPAQALSRQKIRRIYRTAEIYLHEHPAPGVLCRFDFIAVHAINGRLEIDHYKEAFGLLDFMDMD